MAPRITSGSTNEHGNDVGSTNLDLAETMGIYALTNFADMTEKETKENVQNIAFVLSRADRNNSDDEHVIAAKDSVIALQEVWDLVENHEKKACLENLLIHLKTSRNAREVQSGTQLATRQAANVADELVARDGDPAKPDSGLTEEHDDGEDFDMNDSSSVIDTEVPHETGDEFMEEETSKANADGSDGSSDDEMENDSSTDGSDEGANDGSNPQANNGHHDASGADLSGDIPGDGDSFWDGHDAFAARAVHNQGAQAPRSTPPPTHETWTLVDGRMVKEVRHVSGRWA